MGLPGDRTRPRCETASSWFDAYYSPGGTLDRVPSVEAADTVQKGAVRPFYSFRALGSVCGRKQAPTNSSM